jgi:hypothetical protein
MRELNLFNEINRVTSEIYGGLGMSMNEVWYYALDKKGRRLGLIHANSDEHAMQKARQEFGLAVVELEDAEEEARI